MSEKNFEAAKNFYDQYQQYFKVNPNGSKQNDEQDEVISSQPQIDEVLSNINGFYSKLAEQVNSMQNDTLSLFPQEIVQKTIAETCKVAIDKFAQEPGKWKKKQIDYLRSMEDLFNNTINKIQGIKSEPIISPHSSDKRFKAPEWEEMPIFDYLKQSYLLQTSYIDEVIESLDDINPKTKEKVQFYTRNLMNALAPSNFAMTNPEVWKEINKTKGQNIINGYKKLINDNSKEGFLSLPNFTDLTAFKVGENLATTPGKVIFENNLFQLIYYKPIKPKSYETPLLVIPPWINKYYIFDLQKENSFVRWMLEKGISVFMLSWVNPDESYAKYTLEQYVIDGALRAIEEILSVTNKNKINVMAYCTGGVASILMMGYLAKQNKDYVESLTLLASPIDFEKMGDLKVFVCDEQLEHMEKNINKLGYLPGDSMTRVFSMLRSNDLVWSNYVNTYLLDKEPFTMDFLYWNCDTTHIPAKMHIEYLRHIFYENALMKANAFKIKGIGIDLSDIKTPVFVFATKSDHIVPWQSAFAIKEFCPNNTKFILGASGHVAGIINPASNNKYCYWKTTKKIDMTCKDPDLWFESAERIEGSWWKEWGTWIKKFSGKKIENNIWKNSENFEMAPGRYAMAPLTK